MHRLKPICMVTLLWPVVVSVTSLKSQQAQPVAGVLDFTGNWQLYGQQDPVRLGQKLYAGDKLSTASYSYANSLTIVNYNDGSRTRISCENSSKNPCASPYIVNAPTSTASQGTSLFKAALNLLLGTPLAVLNTESTTISRGMYVVSTHEDVVKFDRGKGLSLNGRVPVLP